MDKGTCLNCGEGFELESRIVNSKPVEEGYDLHAVTRLDLFCSGRCESAYRQTLTDNAEADSQEAAEFLTANLKTQRSCSVCGEDIPKWRISKDTCRPECAKMLQEAEV